MNYPAGSQISFFRYLFTLFCMIACMGLLTGCDAMRNQLKPDRSGNNEIQDYRDGLAPRLPEIADANNPSSTQGSSIPGLQPYVAAPDSNMKSMPLVSISVNQSVPLRDILFQLAEQADYDLELDPRITGSIIFTARERPFDEVVERISDVAGLRYKFDNDVLRVELDTPYNKVYKIDYLSYVRKNKGKIANNISVVNGDGADTGSQYEASAASEADFWGELEENLKQILGGAEGGALKTKKTPKVTATAQNPEVEAVAPAGPAGEDGNVEVNVQPPQATLKVESLPVDEEDDSGKGGKGKASAATSGFTFTINKQAGIVNIYASEKGHKEVETYLKMLRRAVTAQVLIEAKILEVSLNDAYQSGVNWSSFNMLGGHVDAVFPVLGEGDTPTATASTFAATLNTGDFSALVEALSTFGTVKALASPRMTVLNNQSSVLNVATNHVYFDVDLDVTTDADTGRTVDISSDAKSVPIGVLVNVQPSINLENNTISLAVRPTITRLDDEIEDPAVKFVAEDADIDVQSLVPQLNVQEIDSVVEVKSGQPIVMGGLLQDRTDVTDNGIPVLSETPVVGNLFKNHTDQIQKTELVIFLKATILQSPGDSVHATDKDLYRAFSEDRRPLKF